MRYSLRILSAVITFVVGVGIFFLWTRVWSDSASPGMDNRVPVANITGKVTFRFIQCAGNRAVFLLDNGTDHRIYARVHRADFWREFKEADLEFGVHLITYRAPDGADFVDVGPTFDAVNAFRTIMPRETIRYGVDLGKRPGEYIVKVPYMEDAEVARRLDEDFASIIKNEFELVKASWKQASSDVVTNTCNVTNSPSTR